MIAYDDAGEERERERGQCRCPQVFSLVEPANYRCSSESAATGRLCVCVADI